MVPRIEYINNRIKWFKQRIPTIFHKEISLIMYEIYAPIINTIDDEIIIRSIRITQKGGGIEKMYTMQFEDCKFKVLVEKDEDEIRINILGHIGLNPVSCANIIIRRDTTDAILNNISYHKDCIKPIKRGFFENATGSTILKFILNFLKRNKNELKINRILLTDSSYKICPNCQNVNLSDLNMLLYGDTWYGKYGFRPYDKTNCIPDKFEIARYNKNKKIIQKTLVKDVKLANYIKNGILKYKLFHLDRNFIIKLVDDNANTNLSDFLIQLMKNYDKYCCLFEYIQRKIIIELGLKSFHKDSFYLDI